MLMIVFVKVVLIGLVKSDSCNSTIGQSNNLFSCIGCTVVLECSLNKTGNSVVWSRGGKPVFIQDKRLQYVKGNKLRLQITDLIMSDKDQYCCYAVYEDFSSQFCIPLHLVDLLIMPNDNIIVGSNGRTVTLQCLITSTYPIATTITWINNGTTLISDQSHILNLTVFLTKELHEQTLTCQAVIACIDLKLEKEVQFNITYAPIVKITALPSTSLNEMDRVTLVCTFEANPKPKFIVWSKNGKIISYADAYEIIDLSRDDKGLYECNISNGIGYGVDSLQINVLFAPEVSVELLQNDSIYCNATGNPNIFTFLKWKHESFNGQHLRFINGNGMGLLTVALNSNTPIYTIDGRYICTVNNGVKDKNNNTMQGGYTDVYFTGKPVCVAQNDSFIIGRMTGSVMLNFQVYSTNITHYHWSRGDVILTKSIKYDFTMRSTLTSVYMYDVPVSLNTFTIELRILNLTDKDFNTLYTLTSFNEHGNTTCSKTLKELGKTSQEKREISVERLMLIIVSVTLFIIVTILFIRFIQRKMATLSVTIINDPQSIIVGGGQYEEIDIGIEGNIVSSATTNEIEIFEIPLIRETLENFEVIPEEGSGSLPEPQETHQMTFTVDRLVDLPTNEMLETSEEKNVESSAIVTRETIAQMIRETQVQVIRETVEQLMKENISRHNRDTSYTTTSESDSTSIQSNESGYLNPYEPLQMDSNNIEHPYTETTLDNALTHTFNRDSTSGAFEDSPTPFNFHSLCLKDKTIEESIPL